MICLLQNLESRTEEKDTILYRELDEIAEILFIESGIMDVGFEITRKPRYVVRLNKGSLIGAYNCCENVKTLFIFRCRTEIHGFMMRKHIWISLLEDYPHIGEFIKQNGRI